MSDELDLTDDAFFLKVAQHFFNQFLQLKVQLDRGELVLPEKLRREVEGYRRMNEQLKKSIKEYVEENKRLEEALALADEEKVALLGKVNELTIALGRAQDKLRGLGVVRERTARAGYAMEELMDEESRRLWESLMKEIPRPRGES